MKKVKITADMDLKGMKAILRADLFNNNETEQQRTVTITGGFGSNVNGDPLKAVFVEYADGVGERVNRRSFECVLVEEDDEE